MRMHGCGECIRAGMYTRRNCDGGRPKGGAPTRRPQPVAGESPYMRGGWFEFGRQRGTEHLVPSYRSDLTRNGQPIPIRHCPALNYQGAYDVDWINRVGFMLDNQCGPATEWPPYAVALFARVKAERAADDDARQQYREAQAQ